MKKFLVLIPTFLLAVALAVNVYAQDTYIPFAASVQEGVEGTVRAAAALFFPMEAGDTATVVCNADALEADNHTQHTIDVRCIQFTPTPVPHTEPYAGAPLCAAHDDTAYHGLWNAESGCHYDHTHNIDPLSPAVQAVFGDYTEWTGQEISYPWETWGGATVGYPAPPADPALENHHKHEGYKFDFYDLGSYGTCPTAYQGIQAVPNAWLFERHSLGDARDARVRIHSFWGMVRFCIPGTNEQAFIYSGGWLDFGQRVTPYQGSILPYADTPQPAYNSALSPYLSHPCFNHASCPNNRGNFTWSGIGQVLENHKLLGFVFRGTDAIDAIDIAASGGFNNPSPVFVYNCADAQGNFVEDGCAFNNSKSHTFQVTGNIANGLDMLDGVADGRVNHEGYTDRWGNVVQGCTAIGLDCVPVRIVNMPVGSYHVNLHNFDAERFLPPFGEDVIPEHDILFDDQPSGWIGPDN